MLTVVVSGQSILTKGRIARGSFFTWDNVKWHWPVRSIAAGCRSPAFTIFFAAQSATALIPMLFTGSGNPKKVPSYWGSWSLSNMCSGVSPQMASRSVQSFLYGSPTDTGHAALSLAIGHILCTECMRCGLIIKHFRTNKVL